MNRIEAVRQAEQAAIVEGKLRGLRAAQVRALLTITELRNPDAADPWSASLPLLRTARTTSEERALGDLCEAAFTFETWPGYRYRRVFLTPLGAEHAQKLQQVFQTAMQEVKL